MSSFTDRTAPADADLTNENLRVALFTTLTLFSTAAEILFSLPAAESVLEAGDHERFRLLTAADTARAGLVGHSLTDTPEHPSRESTLGGAETALAWTAEELEHHFTAALADWKERD
jgi:hypothetical protein